MSVYIKLKGTAPRTCAECDRDLAAFAGCIYTQRLVLPSEHDMNAGRHPRCPLIETPRHGRLIDADDFGVNYIAGIPGGIDDLRDKRKAPEFVSMIQALLLDIAEAPTIIPADTETARP